MNENENAKIIVNGEEIECKKGEWLLQVLLREGYDIPHLCYHEAVKPYGACRLCIVEVTKNGRTQVATSCNYPVSSAIAVETTTPKILKLRKTIMELLLASTPNSPALKRYVSKYGVMETRFKIFNKANDCILCGLCARVCEEIVDANAIQFVNRGGAKMLTTPFSEASNECIACGSCVYVCPCRCITLEQTSSYRRIDRWGSTSALHRSEKTGIIFAPTVQIEYFKKVANLPQDFYKLAPGERPVAKE